MKIIENVRPGDVVFVAHNLIAGGEVPAHLFEGYPGYQHMWAYMRPDRHKYIYQGVYRGHDEDGRHTVSIHMLDPHRKPATSKIIHVPAEEIFFTMPQANSQMDRVFAREPERKDLEWGIRHNFVDAELPQE